MPWSLNAEALWWRNDLMDAAPATWDELRAKAMELTNDDMFGYAVQGGRDADWIISETNPIMWGNGGELWDQATYTAQGILNSDVNKDSLQFFVDMNLVDGSIDPASANWTINERLGALLDRQSGHVPQLGAALRRRGGRSEPVAGRRSDRHMRRRRPVRPPPRP